MTPQMADTPQTPPDALQTLSEGYGAPPDRKWDKFTQAELGLILALRAEGKTQPEIAQRLGRSQAAISKALKRLGADSTGLALHHAKAKSYAVARRLARIVEKSSDEDAAIKAGKTLWQAAGVIQSGQQVTVNNAIVVARADDPQTWLPEPVFDGEVTRTDGGESGS